MGGGGKGGGVRDPVSSCSRITMASQPARVERLEKGKGVVSGCTSVYDAAMRVGVWACPSGSG